FDVDTAVGSAAVPSFAVQHLVENAIRHGIAKRSDAGRLGVIVHRHQDTLEISVVDDGAGIDEPAAAVKGHGIDNTRARLLALYGDRASLTIARAATGGTVATLRLPYRELVSE